MKDFFTEEDFYSKNMIQEFFGSPVTGKAILCSDASNYANEKLNKLIESWPVVYGTFVNSQVEQPFGEVAAYGDSHKARLAFIEELPKEPCKHYPVPNRLVNLDEIVCGKCGVELVATWSEKL